MRSVGKVCVMLVSYLKITFSNSFEKQRSEHFFGLSLMKKIDFEAMASRPHSQISATKPIILRRQRSNVFELIKARKSTQRLFKLL